MAKKQNNSSDNQFGDLLNQVSRLRLFRNTNRELGDYIGYKLDTNNSIKDIHPFTARCIFRELSRDIQEKINAALELADVLYFYERTSAFYIKYIRDSKKINREEILFIILKRFYINDYQLELQDEWLRDLFNKMIEKNINIPILLLLMLKIFPLYTSTQGDVKDASADFNKLIAFLRKFVKCNDAIPDLPLISRFEKEVQDGEYCSRMYLFNVAHASLVRFRDFSNSKDLYRLNAETGRIIPDIDNAVWVERKLITAPLIFWTFKLMATNDFFLYRYSINTEKKELSYIRYEAVFMDDGTVCIAHPQYFPYLVKKESYKDLLAFFTYDINEHELPEKIGLKALLKNNFLFQENEFIRLAENKHVTEQIRIALDSYTKKDNYPETDYLLLIMPLAVTPEYIYIKQSSDDNTSEPKYYRVPKSLDEGLEEFSVLDSAGVLTFNKRTYVGFVSIMLYFDVTDEEAREKCDVKIVDRIEL